MRIGRESEGDGGRGRQSSTGRKLCVEIVLAIANYTLLQLPSLFAHAIIPELHSKYVIKLLGEGVTSAPLSPISPIIMIAEPDSLLYSVQLRTGSSDFTV